MLIPAASRSLAECNDPLGYARVLRPRYRLSRCVEEEDGKPADFETKVIASRSTMLLPLTNSIRSNGSKEGCGVVCRSLLLLQSLNVPNWDRELFLWKRTQAPLNEVPVPGIGIMHDEDLQVRRLRLRLCSSGLNSFYHIQRPKAHHACFGAALLIVPLKCSYLRTPLFERVRCI